MNIPFMNVIPSVTDNMDVFKGYNNNERIADNEFRDMMNMSSDKYPLLAPRRARGIEAVSVTIDGEKVSGDIVAVENINDEWCVIMSQNSHNDVNVYKETEDGWTLLHSFKNEYRDQKRTVVMMGSRAVIFPDKVYVDTIASKPEGGSGGVEYKSGMLEAVTETEHNNASNSAILSLCKKDGTGIKYTKEKPSNPSDGDYWLDGTGADAQLKTYSSNSWVTEATTYTKIKLPAISGDFKEGDGVIITYGPYDKVGIDEKTTSVILEKVYDDKEGYGDYFVIKGLLEYEEDAKYYCKVERTVPAMDFVIECNNRLWGCRFGNSNDIRVTVNEIYACALGDPTNWNIFEGTAMDSYAMSLGSEGEFTGAVAHRGYPVFFKEDFIHKIYGTAPSSYQLQTVEVAGVQKDSHGSLAVVNEVLYYKARDTVYAYESSLPIDVGYALGKQKLSEAVSISHNGKYYMYAKDVKNNGILFVYDTSVGLWHKEDFDKRVFGKQSTTDDAYFLVYESSKYNLYSLRGTKTQNEPPFSWYAESGILGLENTDSKRLKKICVRMTVPYGTSVSISVEYDSSGRWEQVFKKTGTSLKAIDVPILAKRCDHFRIRFEGNGEAKIYSISKTYTKGRTKK